MEAVGPVEKPSDITVPVALCASVSFVFIGYLYTKLATYKKGRDIGCARIDELSAEIKTGAKEFLVTEYSYLVVFVFCLAATLFILFYPPSWT